MSNTTTIHIPAVEILIGDRFSRASREGQLDGFSNAIATCEAYVVNDRFVAVHARDNFGKNAPRSIDFGLGEMITVTREVSN